LPCVTSTPYPPTKLGVGDGRADGEAGGPPGEPEAEADADGEADGDCREAVLVEPQAASRMMATT